MPTDPVGTSGFSDYQSWIGATAYDRNGDKLGDVADILYDDYTQRPEWLAINTGFFGKKTSLVPIGGSRVEGDRLVVAVDKAMAKAAPQVDNEADITGDEQRELFRHYGYDYEDRTNRYGGTERLDRDYTSRRYDTAVQDWDREDDSQEEVVAEATTRNEQVVKEQVPETVRLRKYRWTEMVPVQKEEVRVEKDVDTTTTTTTGTTTPGTRTPRTI